MNKNKNLTVDYLINEDGIIDTSENPLNLKVLLSKDVKQLSIKNSKTGIERLFFNFTDDCLHFDNECLTIKNKSELTNLRSFFSEIIKNEYKIRELDYLTDAELVKIINQSLKI